MCWEVRNTSLNKQIRAWTLRPYGYYALIPNKGESEDLCEYENIRNDWTVLLMLLLHSLKVIKGILVRDYEGLDLKATVRIVWRKVGRIALVGEEHKPKIN